MKDNRELGFASLVLKQTFNVFWLGSLDKTIFWSLLLIASFSLRSCVSPYVR